METEKLFYSFLQRNGYKGKAPDFFDNSDSSWHKNIESSYNEILNELNLIATKKKIENPYFDKDIVSKQNSWKTIAFSAWGVHFKKNKSLAPKTNKLLNQIPGYVSASFNKLSPHAEIKPHFGDTDAIMRCHLGLIIPGSLPEIGFMVNNKKINWREGKILSFCDAHLHNAWNNTEKDRYILLFDIIRPEYLHKKRSICAKVLSSLFLQSLSQKIPLLRKLPFPLQKLLFYCAIPFAYVLTPIKNLF